MVAALFPLRKLRRNSKYVVFGMILLVGAVAFYNEISAARALSEETGVTKDDIQNQGRGKASLEQSSGESPSTWTASFVPQPWKAEYLGEANLHVFEDWCGSSTTALRRNLHYPLFPHSRTTVQKLAVSPHWTNYGLRIFGYLHPHSDGEFVFAVSSDDNSEFWLSSDDSPLNLRLLAWVGTTGEEWTAPGEFDKYASQTSKPTLLMSQRRYFFEILHKQNDRGTDHVEVAWQLLHREFQFSIIESKHISLYVNESALLIGENAHIPQTAASHRQTIAKRSSDTADILKSDPRDNIYQVPLVNKKYLQGILPQCLYQPSYTIKDYPLRRYQGLEFVQLSYVYPNDYTRLTHMETENSCFYPESPYLSSYRFSRYMTMDKSDFPQDRNIYDYDWNFGFQRRQSTTKNKIDDEDDVRTKEDERKEMKNDVLSDYGDDYDDYVFKRRRKIFSVEGQESNNAKKNSSANDIKLDLQKKRPDIEGVLKPRPQKQAEPQVLSTKKPRQNQIKERNSVKRMRDKKKGVLKAAQTQKAKVGGNSELEEARERGAVKSKQAADVPEKDQKSHVLEIVDNRIPLLDPNPPVPKKKKRERFIKLNQERAATPLLPPKKDIHDVPLKKGNSSHRAYPLNERNSAHEGEGVTKARQFKKWDLWNDGDEDDFNENEDVEDDEWEAKKERALVFDTEVNWNRTFKVNRNPRYQSDRINLQCNVSGNLQLSSSDAMFVVNTFMEKLHENHPWTFTLVQVVNVEKHMDMVRGARYLLELELKDRSGNLLRLSHYIYILQSVPMMNLKERNSRLDFQQPEMILCDPVGFSWNPKATVHFIVPVKNQARWVLQLIRDLEEIFKVTGDSNFNLIISDYYSTDLDVREALEKSSLPSHQYVNLDGNFQRAAGLQAGVDLIKDPHSIVFLCDLHIHFPPSIIDTIRKHCVEGYMAFAPIVMRLDCGATPAEAKGYWEVNGFGLLAIYKSDLDQAGGMNTKEFRERWGGEDWELLDRILQAGLEVERLYLRNFYHYFHSRRGMWNRRLSRGQR
ncbi:beta-1,4-N-acetylgalactosaminyltransferase 3 [Synchiropus splendidus]|uniref:beta-1,4-N-acetylgalactosaminyltransferase 3 n=1 Tax=Synchiropus splendidus TaxID=270530 RepID=UPI00237DEE1F|nr:beta-1,4-N-acetylgalactosaminyltransferase 3 [Synchiropus splendidus]